MYHKYRRKNYKYGLTKKGKHTLKQGMAIALLICVVGGSLNKYEPPRTVLISPLGSSVSANDIQPSPIPGEPETIKTSPTPTQPSSVEEMIAVAFPDAPKTAVAIAKAESNLQTWRTHIDYRECSIGLFQINLAKGDCKGTKVHWDKVPGTTAEEKIEYLKDVSNNIRIAKIIYNESGGFWPWSVYKNKSYLKYLDEGEFE